MNKEYYGTYIILNKENNRIIDRLNIFLPLKAAPKGSWTTFIKNGRTITKPANDREAKVAKQITSAIIQAVKDGAGLNKKESEALRQQGPIQTKDPYDIDITFKFENKNPQIPKTTMPDLDKLLRSVNDAITKTSCLWFDDAQVSNIYANKINGARDEIIIGISRHDPIYYPHYKVVK